MANFSNYLENKIVGWLNGDALATITTNLYVALYTAPLEQSNSATYLIGFTTSRVEVNNWTVTTASNASDSIVDATITNSAEITMTASSNVAATASHFGVYDAVSNGNLLFHGALSSNVVIAVSDSVKFAANAITLTVQ